jgi:hypothetical protein
MSLLRKKQNKRDFLGERIITCNGLRVYSTDCNLADNIGRGKVVCSCGMVVLWVNHKYHIQYCVKCIEYHKITRSLPEIIHKLL